MCHFPRSFSARIRRAHPSQALTHRHRDVRTPELVAHAVSTLVMHRVVGIALGYEDLNEHDEQRHDPVLSVRAGEPEARREDCAGLSREADADRRAGSGDLRVETRWCAVSSSGCNRTRLE